MKYLMFLASFLLVAIMVGCGEKQNIDETIGPPVLELLEGNVVLQDLNVGQKSFFVNYTSSCEEMTTNFAYTGDTLVWEVLLQGGSIVLKEEYTPNSPFKLANPLVEPVIYPVDKINNGILLKERFSSGLFYFYGNDTLRLNHAKDIDLVQEECLMMNTDQIFIGDEVGHIDIFKIGDMEVKDKTVVSCVPIFNLDAYLIYSDNHLYCSHAVSTSEFNGDVTRYINGWQLLK